MVTIKNLTKSDGDGRTILSGVGAVIGNGELVAIVGSSGSGKTTLLRCLTLQEKWDKGKLIYNGKDIFAMGWKGKRLIRREWAYMDDQPQLNLRSSAHKNVLSGSRKRRSLLRLLTGTVSAAEYEDGMDFLIQAGLMNKAHNKVEKLSGGEVKRVALAKALAERPKVIAADEPVTNLDPQTAQSIMGIIKNLCKKEGLTFICTISQLDLAERFATRILGLSEGGIVFDVPGRRLTQEEKDLIR